MISGTNFVWLHLPKTGGTSTARLFQSLNLEGVIVDDETQDAKHQSLEDRLRCGQDGTETDTNKKQLIITSRRLTSWLLSDWHHKTLKMGLKLPFSPVKSGLFYSLRLGGTWVAADYWIHYFQAEECDHVIRLEHIKEDAEKIVLPLIKGGPKSLDFPKSNANIYSKKPHDFFSDSDIQRINENNPAWSKWERKIYENWA